MTKSALQTINSMKKAQLIKKTLLNLTQLPKHILERLSNSRFGGGPVKHQEGNITFDLGGFASAGSRPLLLARHNYEILYIQKYLQGKEFRKSLEIGCGYGRLSPIFAEYADTNFAVDINENAINIAKKHYSKIDFEVQNAMDLSFPDDNFDLVTTWTSLQHIPPKK